MKITSKGLNSHDLPRDKESFNKRKEAKRPETPKTRKPPSNLLTLFEKTLYYLPQTGKTPFKKSFNAVKDTPEDLKRLLKGTSFEKEGVSSSNNMILQRKWRESQEKSLEQAGKIVNQTSKLKGNQDKSEEMPQNRSYIDLFDKKQGKYIEDNEFLTRKQKNNYIDEKKPNKGASLSLADKLKKEILLINEQKPNKPIYQTISFVKEQRSISVRRNINEEKSCLSEEEEEEENKGFKKHLQRKSLYPGGFLENKTKGFEKKDIEKIYKEYKSRKF